MSAPDAPLPPDLPEDETNELDVLVRHVLKSASPRPSLFADPEGFARACWEEARRRPIPVPLWKRRWVRVVAALMLVGAVVTWLAVRPASPEPAQPKTVHPPREESQQAPPRRSDEIDASLKPDELVATARTFDKNVVFSGDRFTHSAVATTRRRFGWCYQIDAAGAQLLYTLRPDGPQRLVGRLPKPRTFDKPAVAVYEYFVVILADVDNPAFGSAAGKGDPGWVTAQVLKSLQAEGRPGPATPAAELVLRSAIKRLGLGDDAFGIGADCYLHQPNPR